MSTTRRRIAPYKLPPHQWKFVEEYLADPELNAGRAYRKAYPNCNSEGAGFVGGSRMLSKPEVLYAIAEEMKKRAERMQVTQDEVIEGLRAETQTSGEKGQANARVRAWELLGKHIGLFPDRREHTGKDGGPIEYVETRVVERADAEGSGGETESA